MNRIGTWNVEGMRGPSEVKFAELRISMRKHGISVLCIQETHLVGAEHFVEDGFMTFLSWNCGSNERSYAGVGFMVAPWAHQAVVCFNAISDRLACLRLKVSGGVLNLLSVYAPHDGIDFNIRHQFFSTLSEHTRVQHEHETSLVLADFNS